MLLACGFIVLTLNRYHTPCCCWMRKVKHRNETSTLHRYGSHEWAQEARRVAHRDRRYGIGRSSSLAPRQHKKKHQQQQQRKQSAHASMALRRKRIRLRRREIMRFDGVEMEMEMVNLKLYLENRCILEENERLREKASALRRENLALRADLHKTSPAPAILMPAAAASSC